MVMPYTHVTLCTTNELNQSQKENANTYDQMMWITLCTRSLPASHLCARRHKTTFVLRYIQFIAHFVHCKFHYFQQLLPFRLTDCVCARKRVPALSHAQRLAPYVEKPWKICIQYTFVTRGWCHSRKI